MTEYPVSVEEIRRRIQAFTALVASLIASLLLLALVLLGDHFALAMTYVACMTLFFLVFWLLIFRFFKTYLSSEVNLDEQSLTRLTGRSREAISLLDITALAVRKTTRGKIRQIKITLKNGRNVFIDGLENFEDFRACLTKALGKDIPITEYHEKIDYDHPAFYPIVGPIIALIITGIIKVILDAPSDGLKAIGFGFTVSGLALSAYFVLAAPLAKRYGKTKTTDYACGLFAFTAAALCFIVTLKLL